MFHIPSLSLPITKFATQRVPNLEHIIRYADPIYDIFVTNQVADRLAKEAAEVDSKMPEDTRI